MSPAPSDRPGPARLVGWKDIADALGKSVRTVQRWERELGLPVRRVRTSDSGHCIYAEPAELAAWLARQSAGTLAANEANPEDRDEPAESQGSTAEQPGAGGPAVGRRRAWVAAATLVAVAGALAAWRLGAPAEAPAAATVPRLVAEAAVRADSNDLLYVTDNSGVVVLNGGALDADPVHVITFPPDASFVGLGVSAPSPDGRLLLTATVGDSGVAVFDLTTPGYRGWFPVPRLRRIARARLSPDATTLVVVEQDGRVHVLDARTGIERDVVSVAGQNFDGRFDRTGRYFFVPNRDADNVSVIDVAELREIDKIPTGDGAHNIVVAPDGGRGFVSNAYEGSVSCVDLVERRVIDTIPVGDGPYELAISLDGHTVYVANREGGSLVAIDARACTERARVERALDGARPGAIAVSNDGSRVYVAAFEEPFIGVFDATCPDLRPVGRIPLRTVASSILPGPLSPLVPADDGEGCEAAAPRAASARPARTPH